uniref:VWFA domain-containing protein n=1 Tax=Strigamia maritima TaxID=126957 RepID=T1J4G3_STRMM
MASTRRMLPVLLTIFLVIKSPRSTAEFSKWQIKTPNYVSDLAEALVRLMNRTADIDHLETIYGDLTGAELKLVSKTQLLKKMAKVSGDVFSDRMAALKRLVERAENAVMNYSFNPMYQEGDVAFVNVKKIDENEYQYNPNFKNKVNLNTSAVHIPVEIYEGYPIIQNEIKWSGILDRAFKRNHELYSDLSWQFFGSQTGMMRFYPATKWRDPPEDIPDLYDVRRRPWYIEASTSPKDMLILIDTSGSVHGQTLQIIKMSVKALLNTLGENDYVNIASFSKTVEWISCFHTFVQASSVNKLILFEAIERLKDGETASYSKALEFAFEEFKKFDATKKTTDGSDCHKVIMFFTDGGTEDPKQVYRAENNTAVRIFTFATGPHAVPVHTIKAMACNNKGYFTSISSLGAIRDGVQDYVNVLSRPMVLSGEKQFELTNFYDDVMGLGMVTTITLPVYNRSLDGVGQSIVGVMGVDIPVKSLEQLGPNREMGPIGYSFAINHNGFIVFHPDMKTQGDYLDDPPEVDLVDLEEDIPLMNQLRQKMIDRQSGSVISNTIETLPNQKYVCKQEKTYYYTPIPNTTFSLALVFPTGRNYYLSVDASKFNMSEGLGLPKDSGVVAQWPYCKGYPDAPNVSLSDLIKEGKNCNEETVLHLLWDIQKTKSLPHTWSTLLDNYPSFSDYVKTIFLGTEGGLTRIYPESDLFVKKFKLYADTWDTDYYRRALYAKDSWIFSVIVEPGPTVNDSQGIIQAVRSVIAKEPRTFIPGVVGVQFSIDGLMELLLEGNFGDLGFTGSSLSNSDRDQLPCNQEEVICYLIDDGGFIIATSHDNKLEKVTKFLGEEDPELMWTLFTNQIYIRKKTFNYQALCPVVKDTLSSGPRMFYTSQLTFHWLFDLVAWFYFKISLWSLFQSLWAPTTEGIFEFGSIHKEKFKCVTVQHQYYFGENVSFTGEFSCDGCYRKISATRMNGTNLLFVAIEAPCTENGFVCTRIVPPHQYPERVPSTKLCTRIPRYRRRPTPCYAHDDRENVAICNKGSTITIAKDVIMLSLIFLAFLSRQN